MTVLYSRPVFSWGISHLFPGCLSLFCQDLRPCLSACPLYPTIISSPGCLPFSFLAAGSQALPLFISPFCQQDLNPCLSAFLLSVSRFSSPTFVISVSRMSSLASSVVHPDPAGSGIICKLGSVSVINSGSDSRSGFEFGSKLSFVSNQEIQSCKNVQIKKISFCNV